MGFNLENFSFNEDYRKKVINYLFRLKIVSIDFFIGKILFFLSEISINE